MKVLITTDLFVADTNGVVTSVRNLRNELVKRGHDVRILTFSRNLKSYRRGSVYYIKSIPFGIIYPDVRMPVSYRNEFVEELIQWKPDVIHSQCEFFSFQFASRIARMTNAPLVHTYHTLYEQYAGYVIPFRRLGNHLVRILSRERLKNVDRIIAPTKKVEKALHSYGIKNPVCIVPSGISIGQHRVRLTQKKKMKKRHNLGIPDGYQVLLNLGRLGTEKNLNELLKLFAHLLKKNQKLIFFIVVLVPEKEQREELSRVLKISRHVIFTGMVPPSEVQEYYQTGDVFVNASTSETQGLTYIEAAANGLPLVCRKDSCLEDVIKEGVNGYEYSSPKEFFKAVRKVLEDEEWRKEAGKHSEEIARGFDKGCFAENVERVYKEVLRKKSEKRGKG